MTMQRAKFLEDYHRLKAVIGDSEADAVSGQLDGNKEDLETTLATKADIGTLKSDISALEVRLSHRMEELKSDTIKWVAILVIGQMSAIAAIMYAIVKHA